jgi:DNA-binding NarL/FixJ family response regulator
MMMDSTIRVVLVCPKNLVSELLIAAFGRRDDIQVVAHVTSEQEVIDVFQHDTVDIALLDYESRGANYECHKVLHWLRENTHGVRSIVLVPSQDAAVVVNTFRAGAKGVFAKSNANFNLLCKSVVCVHNRQIWASSEELGWMLSVLEASHNQPAPLRVVNAGGANLLSKREEDVVRHLMDGLSNREIAQNLNLSEHTIKNYLFRIFDKLGVSSRTELLLYAMTPRTILDESGKSSSALAS